MLRPIAGIPSGPLYFEVLSGRAFQTSCVENLRRKVVKFEGEKRCDRNTWSSRPELEVKANAKRLALDEGVVEESKLVFSGGKYDWQKFWERALATDQNEREQAWQEATFLLRRWTKQDLDLALSVLVCKLGFDTVADIITSRRLLGMYL